MDTHPIKHTRNIIMMDKNIKYVAKGIIYCTVDRARTKLLFLFYNLIRYGMEKTLITKSITTEELNYIGTKYGKLLDKIDNFQETNLIIEAARLSIGYPEEYNSQLKAGQAFANPKHLSISARHELEKAILEKKKIRREGFLAWAGWFVGILGALTGLASVLSK